MSDREFDVICIGAGPCGEAVARELAGAGLSLAVVEKHLVGGECPYYGCIPSKTLLRSAEVVAEAGRARELAASRVEWDVDFPKVSKRVWWMARDLDDTRPAEAIQQDATLFRGHGALTGPRRVEVDGVALTARRAVVVSTGTSPNVPPIPGLDGVDFWTNREAVLARELPASLAVLGGGAVGVELCQGFARLGTRVTIVEGAPRLVAAEEAEVGEVLRGHLEAEGIRVIIGARVSGVFRNGPDVSLTLEGAEPVTAARLLVATGRRPNLDGFDLAAAGIRTSPRGWVEVDQATLVAADGIWAGGDVNGIGGFTHLSDYHGRVIGRTLRGRACRADHSAVPRVTFTDPEIGSVGLTEAQARERGLDVRVVSADPGEAARGEIHGFAKGLVKLVVDAGRGVLAGVTIVSPRAGEMVSELTLAVRAGVPLPVLADTMHAFPTFSRVLQGVLDQAAGQRSSNSRR
jgi:pyruvate/2-oxoglutarate dehydrogenase complex dihydrolipoamide dehydrogenase (E3) component